jgi:hypothetical protein
MKLQNGPRKQAFDGPDACTQAKRAELHRDSKVTLLTYRLRLH